MAFSPDGKVLTYLNAMPETGLSAVFGLDMSTMESQLLVAPLEDGDTEGTLSLEEKLRRERQRRRSVGITEYWWFPEGSPRLLVPQQGNLYVVDDPVGATG